MLRKVELGLVQSMYDTDIKGIQSEADKYKLAKEK